MTWHIDAVDLATAIYDDVSIVAAATASYRHYTAITAVDMQRQQPYTHDHCYVALHSARASFLLYVCVCVCVCMDTLHVS